MDNHNLIIGTRGSELALWQTNFVKGQLESKHPSLKVTVKIIKTTGDELLDIPLSKIGDKGLFTKQLEQSLLSGEIDIAVHSLKDLQTLQPDGLTIAAVLPRETPNDVLLSKTSTSIDDLPLGAEVLTGSLRRTSQLIGRRPDLKIVDIRGNLPTRLNRFHSSTCEAMILAYAGLHRLGFDSQITQLIPFDVMLPAVGQGAVAIESRSDDTATLDLVRKLDHIETKVCVMAERSFLRKLEGGCQVSIGALATLDNGIITLSGVVGDLSGKVIRDTITGQAENAEELGIELAERIIAAGGDKLIARVRGGR